MSRFSTHTRIFFAIDFAETYGTGNLYTGEGPIRDAEVAAARYFGSEDCFFSDRRLDTGAFSLCSAQRSDAAALSCSTVRYTSPSRYGCALLGITPYFSAPLIEPFAVSGALPVKDAEAQLIAHPEIKAIPSDLSDLLRHPAGDS